MANWLAE